ncbi:MAG: hypothetical protein JW864_14150 [Spirochaetes bacterium]|nr:hypothetical protein [Spirochaetota bacterium]
MAKSEITAGICGFSTTVNAVMEDDDCKITIETQCQHIKKMAEELTEVDPYQEISFKGELPLTYELAIKYLPHAACPVPAGIIKAVEVASRMALPKDLFIKVSKE